jgi:hypothetical protein
MPCWFYDKKDLVNTPSAKDGISAETEAWYRKEGAKHIIDAGNKLGLRFDTCATGVVYFHRFYMFHSFKEFHRLVTAACCLFLAGKVEETPKKCKDIIKTFRSMLSDSQFAHFGEDPKEEVMTLERILLQTIKFDLMVEHPYAYLLKFAKLIKGDKTKIQKMVQMAWTFINDSLCTTLCLQWEPEIIAVAVMYLTSRLTKFDISDWQGKPTGFKGKWYEFLVEDVTLELLEDICHQVLDLYAKAPPPHKEELPAATARVRHPPTPSDDDQSRSTSRTPKSPSAVKRPLPVTAAVVAAANVQAMEIDTAGAGATVAAAANQRESPTFIARNIASRGSDSVPSERSTGSGSGTTSQVLQPGVPPPVTSYSMGNPYMSTQMYSSSFMSTEGSQSIQSLIGVQTREEPQGGRPTYPQNQSNSGQPQQQQPFSTTPTYQSQQQAAATGYPSQRYQVASDVQPSSSGYRSSASSYAQQQQPPYPSYQQSLAAAVAASAAGMTTSGGYQSYTAAPGQPSAIPQQQYGPQSGHSHPTTPVSSTYQGYASSIPAAYSGLMNPGSSQRSGYPSSQQQQQMVSSTGFQGQSSTAGFQPAGYPGQPAAASSGSGYPGQNTSGYQSASGQQHQQQGMRSNNRRENWY